MYVSAQIGAPCEAEQKPRDGAYDSKPAEAASRRRRENQRSFAVCSSVRRDGLIYGTAIDDFDDGFHDGGACAYVSAQTGRRAKPSRTPER